MSPSAFVAPTRRAAVLAAVAAVLVAGGCAHAVKIESAPPGATVLVNGERVGVTPMELHETSGSFDRVPVEVQHGGRAARFAYTTTAISNDAVIAGVGAACLMCLGGAAGVAALPLAAVAAATGAIGIGGIVGGPVFAALFLGGYAAYFGGFMLASYAPYALVGVIGEAGRIGPERIHVDLLAPVPVVTSQPGDMVEPWVGRTAATGAQRY